MPDDEDIITEIIKREGGLVNDPLDPGGVTFHGISKRANPEAWAHGQPTEAEVRAIYDAKYVVGPGWARLEDDRLKAQCIDWSVTSGPHLVIMEMQKLLGLTVDGILGPITLAAIKAKDARTLNNLIMVAHIKMITRLLVRNPSQLRFAQGWVSRACEFLF